MSGKLVYAKMPALVFLIWSAVLPLQAREWGGEVFFGLNAAGGNSDLIAGNVKFVAKKQDSVNLDFSSSYGKSAGERNVDRSSASARRRWDLDGYTYAGLSFSAARDAIAAVDYRYIISPAAGKRILDTERASLSMEAGPAYFLESVADEKDSGPAFRIFELFELELGRDSRLRQSFEYTARSADDYLIGFELGAVSALTSRMSLRAAMELDYNSLPAEGKKKYDLVFITSLGFRF